MKYRLKNLEFQRQLDRITSNKFTRSLLSGVDPTDYCRVFEAAGFGTITIYLNPDALEEVPEYDPTTWNGWTGVEPPRDVPLRLEVREPDEDLDTPEPRFGKIRKKACACFDGNDWFYWPGRSFSSYISIRKGDVVRFRPWVGPDEEAK